MTVIRRCSASLRLSFHWVVDKISVLQTPPEHTHVLPWVRSQPGDSCQSSGHVDQAIHWLTTTSLTVCVTTTITLLVIKCMQHKVKSISCNVSPCCHADWWQTDGRTGTEMPWYILRYAMPSRGKTMLLSKLTATARNSMFGRESSSYSSCFQQTARQVDRQVHITSGQTQLLQSDRTISSALFHRRHGHLLSAIVKSFVR